MKLYLSSQKFGSNIEKLISLCGENKNVVIVANGLDDKSDTYRKERVQTEIENLRLLGFTAEELDLRDFFSKPNALKNYLDGKSMVWIRGGSAFILNRAMIESGFNTVGVEMVRNSRLVYAGYSAALIVATTNLSGTELVDDATVIPSRYSKVTNPFIGLGLIDFYLIPHIDSKEEWARKIPLCVKTLREGGATIVTLKDGEVFVKDD